MTVAVLILIVGLCAAWLAWEVTRPYSPFDKFQDGLEALRRASREE